MLIVFPLIFFFDVIGARIIVSLAVIMFFMLLTNRSFGEMFQLMMKPFVWMWNGITNAATRGFDSIREDFYDDDDDEDDDEDYEDDDEPEEQAEVDLMTILRGKIEEICSWMLSESVNTISQK